MTLNFCHTTRTFVFHNDNTCFYRPVHHLKTYLEKQSSCVTCISAFSIMRLLNRYVTVSVLNSLQFVPLTSYTFSNTALFGMLIGKWQNSEYIYVYCCVYFCILAHRHANPWVWLAVNYIHHLFLWCENIVLVYMLTIISVDQILQMTSLHLYFVSAL